MCTIQGIYINFWQKIIRSNFQTTMGIFVLNEEKFVKLIKIPSVCLKSFLKTAVLIFFCSNPCQDVTPGQFVHLSILTILNSICRT